MKSDVILSVVLSHDEYKKVLAALRSIDSPDRKSDVEARAATLLLINADRMLRGSGK